MTAMATVCLFHKSFKVIAMVEFKLLTMRLNKTRKSD